jgi:hypothetical protein
MQTLDTDQDGLSDYYERMIETRVDAADSDSDGLSDGVEQGLGSNPNSIDTDRDGVIDYIQQQAGSLGPAALPFTSGGIADGFGSP